MKFYKPKKHYRWHPGFIIWLLHRISGLALAAYLFLHIWVLRTLVKGEAEFDQIMTAFDSPFTRLLEVGLLGLVIFHALNGVRVLLMDYGPMANRESYLKYLVGVFVIIVLISLIGGAVMIKRGILG